MESSQQPSAQTIANPILAKAYLSRQGDEPNRLLLTKQSLQVYYRDKGRAFSLEYVEYLALEHRKLWLPLIGGGIVASLCFLALLHTFTMPYLLLTGGAIGLVGFWWGYRGSMALVVHEQRHHTDFLLGVPAPMLPAFLALANRVIRQYPQPLTAYCMVLEAAELQQLRESGSITISQPRHCVPMAAVLHQQPGPGQSWVAFDPYVLGLRLQWSLQGQELVAHLMGEVQGNELWVPS